MTYLNLDKTKLVNLEYSLSREVIRSNRAGSYSSTTVVGCNTRKYHGMLVCPIDHFGGGRFVLLSSLDISLVQHQQVFNLGIKKYQGNHYEPKGHKYMESYEMESTPKRRYRVGGMLLTTEILMVESEDQVLMKVTLDEAHSSTVIRFKPFLAYRSIHNLTHQNMVANTRYDLSDNGIKVQLYEGFPHLNMQLNKENDFIAMPDWYRGVEYIKEQSRGYPFREDLYSPGYFEVSIKKGESLVFSASTYEINPRGLISKFTRETHKRIPRNTLLNNLLNTSEQFIQLRGNRYKLLAGYHWYQQRLRDTLVALPGLMAYQLNREPYLNILKHLIDQVRKEYIAETEFGVRINSRDIDVPLWLFYTIQEVEQMMPEIDVCSVYGDVMVEIIQYYMRLNNGAVNLEENGLLYAKIEAKPLTWMDAVVNGKPVTWRPGYTVEVNALWYNALGYYLEICNKNKKCLEAESVSELFGKVKKSFVEVFWNEKGGYLYDYVDGDYSDESIRPNQIMAVSLKFSPLEMEQKKSIIDIVKKELLTPLGLRTLSPSDAQYQGLIEGSQSQRDMALHQGSVFPWLAAFFAEGYLDLHKRGGLPFIKRMVDDFEGEMENHCLSSISECFNGNPPHEGKGAVSMAWNVAAVIRIINLIEKYN